MIRKTHHYLPWQAEAIKAEAKKEWDGNESALMRSIVTNWFEK